MKIFIQNVTGSQKVEAMLDKDSGVIEYASGEISHVLFEKQAGKTIHVYQNGHHCKLLGKEAVKPVSEGPSTEQSEPRREKKYKAKSN